MKRTVKCVISVFMALAAVLTTVGCTPAVMNSSAREIENEPRVTIKIAIPYETNKALNTVSNAFSDKYPNVNIKLEYIEDYDKNALALFKDGTFDVIMLKDVKYEEYTVADEDGESKLDGTTTEDFFYDFVADTEIDFSHTTPDLTDNYRHTRTDENGNELVYQYCYPLGGEMRGVFVNVTMLNGLGLKIPENYDELTECCKVIKQAGYVPIQGNISTLAYGLGISQAANSAVHNSEALAAMAAADEGVSKYFEDTISKIYTLAVNRYVDYKTIENTGFFVDVSELGQARSFLGLAYDETTFETVVPSDKVGNVAFFPYISSTETVIRELIDKYELDTEVKFICTPLNDADSSSPAYITPHYGICANKNSESIEWIKKFVNFLFEEDNIQLYADNATIIPNSLGAVQYAAKHYGLDKDKDITFCGQIRFSSDYNGFTPLAAGILNVSKCNAEQYMVALKKDDDGNILYEKDENGQEFLLMGNGKTAVSREFIGEEDSAMPGSAFCTQEYYMDYLEKEFEKYRNG